MKRYCEHNRENRTEFGSPECPECKIEALQKDLAAMTADRDRWKARAEMFPTLDETLKWLDADNEVFGSAHAAFRQAIRSTYAFLKAKGKE